MRYVVAMLVVFVFLAGCQLLAPKPVIGEEEIAWFEQMIDDKVMLGEITVQEGIDAKAAFSSETMTVEEFNQWKSEQSESILEIISQWTALALGGGGAGTVVWMIRRMLKNSQPGKLFGPLNGKAAKTKKA